MKTQILTGQTMIGICNFSSIVQAMRYYRDNGNETLKLGELRQLVIDKIADKSIKIGEPSVKLGQKVFLNTQEGRYFICG